MQLTQKEAQALVDSVLAELESLWPGEYPVNRLDYLRFAGYEVEDSEFERIETLQSAAKKLVEAADLRKEYEPN